MKGSIADEAIDFMESSLTKNFEDSKVKMSDRVYQIMKPIGTEEEIEIEVNLKKNNWLVERSAKRIQTCSEDAPV